MTYESHRDVDNWGFEGEPLRVYTVNRLKQVPISLVTQ
jgi:hypothetical protein